MTASLTNRDPIRNLMSSGSNDPLAGILFFVSKSVAAGFSGRSPFCPSS